MCLGNQPGQSAFIDPFTHDMYLTNKDWLILVFGTVFIAPFRAFAVIFTMVMCWILAKIGLYGLDEEPSIIVSRKGIFLNSYRAYLARLLWVL